jgi:hypothetical protein
MRRQFNDSFDWFFWITVAICALLGCGAIVARGQLMLAPSASFVTLTGTMYSSNGLPIKNATLAFKPTQTTMVAGTGIIVASTTNCATSFDGTVVGLPDVLTQPSVVAQFTGTLGVGNYSVRYAWYDSAGHIGIASPSAVVQLTGQGSILATPAAIPSGAVGYKVYASLVGSAETLQMSVTGGGSASLNVPLVAGAALPTSNTTLCQQIANDAMWPTVGYTVSLLSTAGNSYPGFPMVWQMLGPGTSLSLSNGLPTYRGTVLFPAPLLQQPINHAQQSISGPLSMSGYNLTGVGALGVGVNNPGYAVDILGMANASTGYVFNGGVGVTSGQCLVAGSTAPYAFTPQACQNPLTLFYQTVASNGTAQAQLATLNFSPRFAVTSTTSTNVDLGASGVTAGSYAYPQAIGVDAYGRITSVTPGGSSIAVTQHVVTGSRSFGNTYTNTGSNPMWVVIAGLLTTGAGHTCNMSASVGSGSPSSVVAYGGVTNSSGYGSMSFVVPSGYTYQTATNFGPGSTESCGLAVWTEWN